MYDPSAYMSDGSYEETYNSGVGDRAYYTVNTDPTTYHSAIYSKPGSVFKSKWGNGGVYLHRYWDCPYGSATIQYYRIDR